MPQIKTSAETKPADPPTEAELLLDAAILKVKSLENVEADLNQSVSMLGQNFRVTGNYMKGPGYRIRMELNLKDLGDSDGTLLQVCDGKVLWDYQRIAQAQNYRRLAIDKILARIEGPEFEQEIRDQIIGSFGFTGPEALLTGLRKSVLFDQKEEDTVDDRKVWILRGFWKDRAALVSPGQPAPSGALPPYIPSVIALTIGQEDGWPYKLEMKGRIRVGPSLGGAAEKKAATPAARPDQVSSLTLTYSNVKLNAEIDPAKFAFTAPDPRIVPNVVVVDQTDEWLSRLNEAAAQLAEKARRGGGSAGKAEEPITPSISVPKPPGEPATKGPSSP